MKTVSLLIVFLTSMNFGMRSYAQSSGIIYGITQDSANSPASVIAFDCATLQSSIIHTFTGLPGHYFVGAGWDDHTAIDPYNRRLFWIGYTAGDMVIRTLDLTSFKTSVSSVLPESAANRLTYDCYNNRLLIKGGKELLLSYDLGTDVVDTVAPIPLIYYSTIAQQNAFNAFDQQFICTKPCAISPPGPANIDSIYFVNVNSGVLARKASLGYPGINYIQFDDKRHEFYGLGGPSLSQIYVIDTTTLKATAIASVASDSMSNVTTDYDADNGLFMIFYQVYIGVSQLQRRIAMYDVATGRRTLDTQFQVAAHEHYVGLPTSFRLQPVHNKLNAIYGQSYAWSLNDTLLPAERSQTLAPLRPGNYRCEVTFFNGTQLKSAEYNLPALAVPGLGHPAANFVLSPNPFHDHCTITFPTTGTVSYTLMLVNNLGQIVREEQGQCNGKLVINKENLPSGTYYYELSDEAGELSKGKIEIY